MNLHPLEVAFLVVSSAAVLAHGTLLYRKMSDLRIEESQAVTDEVVMFLITDKIRHQSFRLAQSAGAVGLAISGLFNTGIVSPQTKTLLSGAIVLMGAFIVEAFWIYRRRQRMDEFGQKYPVVVKRISTDAP